MSLYYDQELRSYLSFKWKCYSTYLLENSKRYMFSDSVNPFARSLDFRIGFFYYFWIS